MNIVTHRRLKAVLVFALAICGVSREARALSYVTIPQDPTGGGFQAWPDVARLQDGRLMCVFYNGNGHGSTPASIGRIDYSISTNEGYTWSTPSVLYDSPNDDHDSSITQLSSGQVIVSFFSDNSAGWGSGVMTMTSNNLGSTWSAPQQIAPYPYFTSSPVRELSNGRLILGIYYQTGSSSANGTAFGAVLTSDNHGQSWSQPVTIPLPPLTQEQWLCAETDVIQLKDSQGHLSGNLYAAQRTNFSDMFFSTSADFGSTWTQSQDIGFPAMCPYLHRAPDGTILLAYRDYYAGTTSLRYSTNECQTWSNEVVVDTVGGAYPSITDLEDGSELITYYEEGAGSNIRVKRFSVTAGGIDFLPVVPMPEPGTICLLLTGAIGLLVYGWWKRK